MNALEYFYRMGPAEFVKLNMFLPRMCLFVGILWAMRTRITDQKINCLIIFGLIFQVALIAWYSQDGSLLMSEGLPLYHCRIVTLTLAVMWWLKKDKYLRLFAILGLLGAVTAYAVPDASPYAWPHITIVTFIGYHFNLALLSVLLLRKTKGLVLDRDSIFRVILTMNGIIAGIDYVIGANYGYLMHLPMSLNMDLPPFILWLGISGLMILFIALFEFMSSYFPKAIKHCSV